MSEHMKKPRISGVRRTSKQGKGLSEVSIRKPMGKVLSFKVPSSVASEILSWIEDRQESASWREAFSKDIEKIGGPALALKGARVKEGITQKKLADLLGISQVYISQLENGQREINKSMAKKLEKVFNVNYKVFL